MSDSTEFFKFARLRQRIKLDRDAGFSAPWTDDKVLQTYRFCNIFREDDKTTAWFRENIRDPLRDDVTKVFLATVGFRWFNRIEVGELIKDILLEDGWNAEKIREKLVGVKPIVTGAYMIKTPAKMNKLEGILWCMNELQHMPHLFRLMEIYSTHRPEWSCSLEEAWVQLKKAPYLGEFMAYEVITDLHHTCILENATDAMTWANPGPGAARGLGWVLRGDPTVYNRHSESDREVLMTGMRYLLEESTKDYRWPSEWPQLEMREVEHTLCEFDKWKRGHGGQRLKRRYR